MLSAPPVMDSSTLLGNNSRQRAQPIWREVSLRGRPSFGLPARAAFVAAFLASVAPSHAGQDGVRDDAEDAARPLETKNIFGFTSGTDIGPAQDRELEFETNLAFGKRTGAYAFGSQAATLEVNPTDWVEIDTGLVGSFHRISGVEGLDDSRGATLGGVETKFSFVLVHRSPQTPFGVTLSIEPEWSRVDESGRAGWSFGAETRFIVDAELIPEKLYAAANLIYAPEFSSAPEQGRVERTSSLGFAAALAWAFDEPFRFGAKQVVLGAEVGYLRAYDQLTPADFLGRALYVGPTAYIHFNDKLFLAAAFSTQVAGAATGVGRTLDLVNFSRSRAKMTIGVEF